MTPKFETECKLKDLNLYKKDGKYYLSATYLVETPNAIEELYFPKLELPVTQNGVMVEHPGNEATVYLGFGGLKAEKDENGVRYGRITIKEKIHEMTLEEIEKKLGYKVKVVSEKKEGAVKGRDCDKCKFGYHNDCRFTVCKKCPNRVRGKCNCDRITTDQECPYFKEA